MAIPDEIVKAGKDKHSIFLYCKDLWPNANDLSILLETGSYVEVWTAKDVTAAEKLKAPIVWLVGHGSSKIGMVDTDDNLIVGMDTILTWCKNFGATHVIDTACYSQHRAEWVKTQHPSLKYYCKRPNAISNAIGKYGRDATTLDKWWDGESFDQRWP